MKPSFLLILLGLLFSSTPGWAENANTVKVFVNSSVPERALSINNVRSIFSMRTRSWSDGSAITVFILKDKQGTHNQFVRQSLRMAPHQLQRSWDRYRYTGTGQTPIELANEQQMIQRIATTPGAIGYTSQEFQDAQVQPIHIH
ncbi:MAG: substrate-binding domain-containing protein [Motiliproteus sp.]